MSYNLGRRNRLRKGKRGITTFYGYGPRATYRPIYNKHRRTTPEWGALHRAWVGYVIAKSQDDYDKMKKYAVVIRKFQRRLNIALSDFLDIGVYGFEDKEDFENKEEDDDSKLAIYDPWSSERMQRKTRMKMRTKTLISITKICTEDSNFRPEQEASFRYDGQEEAAEYTITM